MITGDPPKTQQQIHLDLDLDWTTALTLRRNNHRIVLVSRDLWDHHIQPLTQHCEVTTHPHPQHHINEGSFKPLRRRARRLTTTWHYYLMIRHYKHSKYISSSKKEERHWSGETISGGQTHTQSSHQKQPRPHRFPHRISPKFGFNGINIGGIIYF